MNEFLGQNQQMMPQSAQGMRVSLGDEVIDLARYLRAILHYKWPIVGLGFALTLLAGLWVYTLEPIYRASASIVMETQEANVVNVEQVYTMGHQGYDYYQTQFEILKSRSLAERVVRKLNLHKHPYFASSAAKAAEKEAGFSLKTLLPARSKEPPLQLTEEQQEALDIKRATGYVVSGLDVSPVDYSHIAYLSFESTDARLTAEIVNAAAQAFIDSNLENRLEGTLQATQWLTTRLEDLKESLGQSEMALQAFRDEEGLVDIAGVTGSGGSELQLLSLRMEQAREARIEAQNIKDDVESMGSTTTEELMTVPAVLQHQVIRDIKREQSLAERRLSELGKRYGQKHPKIISAQSDLNAATRDLATEVRKVVSGISREYELALRNEEELEASWEARKSEMQEFNRVEFRLQELQREVDTNLQLYNIFFTRIKNVSETGGFEKPHARIVDSAAVPGSPVRPKKRLIVMAALVVSLLFGCAVAILLDILDNTVKRPEDIHEKLSSSMLGTIPKMKIDNEGSFEQVWQNPQGIYAEAIRTIRTGVVLSSLDDPAKIIVVTSTLPGEGKSTTVLNLGAAFGQMENTLVIGADLRRPSLARMCNLTPNQQGLSHFVSGAASLDSCIENVEELGIYVMPAGIIPPNPLEMISSRLFVNALEQLKERFDRIVIDSAPVQAVSDALILASYADSVIYLVEANSTSATQARKGIAAIVANNEPLTGVILNQFDAKKARSYYGSGYEYGDYYASQSETH
ncbi:polysaccharide biosynthesis tyrosine autokinase [Halieaceae bacterium IMCC8485]|jgi:capsular exopolysaccharide synthesis family protein|uniref:non-specific protein-tyrosine kinase n=1 Tax=Candidatus Seongchinamella marina TaxID=2518990 RepID=A0ABT3SZE0_9GAMM|nr:polysaccharide biosynthesis tyrosine autokinase [Candidatus Seongchinamella marina]MCX2975348.1 polysaccharide biosynthesis tyrosine autokinase [Candidatus Seongchinamella marina]